MESLKGMLKSHWPIKTDKRQLEQQWKMCKDSDQMQKELDSKYALKGMWAFFSA